MSTDDHPVVVVSRRDATAFCRWLGEQTGRTVRLPTEAEWEYAARAGRREDSARDLGLDAWYGENASGAHPVGARQANAWGDPHPVARKQPNAWGFYDMHGNVWEWCLDFFALSYDGAPVDGRPRWNVDGPTDVVSRGGSFANPPGWLASGCRMGTRPSASHYNNGFRLVRVMTKSDEATSTPRSEITSPRSQ